MEKEVILGHASIFILLPPIYSRSATTRRAFYTQSLRTQESCVQCKTASLLSILLFFSSCTYYTSPLTTATSPPLLLPLLLLCECKILVLESIRIQRRERRLLENGKN